ncbi:hypothetical protein A2W24_02200 [Microgenomates group bacterium RBG_16_45_19]|nr:MAG: hypothetical protein A2W24_02200 [Microgenomates group bacterium RBG_16_45_19]
MLRLILVVPVLFTFCLWISPQSILAQTAFQSRVKTTYTVDLTGLTQVHQIYTITNLTASAYAAHYSLDIASPTVNRPEAYSLSGEAIVIEALNQPSGTSLTLTFPEKTVGKGKELTFSLTYFDPSLSQKIGSALHLTLPGFTPDSAVQVDTTTLMIPLEFGAPVSLSPDPDQVQSDPAYTKLIYFSTDRLAAGLKALFGDKQTYQVALNYQLINATITPVDTQITLPPDTPNQRVYLEHLTPDPVALHADADGNWLATYHLDPRAELLVDYLSTVVIYGSVQPDPHPRPAGQAYLASDRFWPVDDPKLLELANHLQTPTAIYQYLVTQPQAADSNLAKLVKRSGSAPVSAQSDLTSLDYADAFITLARAAGIPARLHRGYGILTQPLTPSQAGLGPAFHAWADYYDQVTAQWRPVDPTWGQTAAAAYFNQLDLNHLTLRLHGVNPEPSYLNQIPGPDPALTDINVSVTERYPPKTTHLTTAVTLPLTTRLGLTHWLTLTLVNASNYTLYDIPLTVSVSNRDLVHPPSQTLPALIPSQTANLKLQFKPSWPQPTSIIMVNAYGQTDTHLLHYYTRYVSSGLLLGGAVILAGLAFSLARPAWRLLFPRSSPPSTLPRQSQKPPSTSQ